MSTYDDMVARRKKREEESSRLSSSSQTKSSTYDGLVQRRDYRNLGMDTLDAYIQKANEVIMSNYSTWKNPEQLEADRQTVLGALGRVNKLYDYGQKYGIDNSDQVKQLGQNYLSTLKGWKDIANMHGQYQTADAFDTAMKNMRFDEQYKGLSYDDVKNEMAKYKEGSDEYNYLSGYSNFSDLREYDKKIADMEDGDEKTMLQNKRNQYALDHQADLYKDVMQNEDFKIASTANEKYSADDSLYKLINADRDSTYGTISGKLIGSGILNDSESKYWDYNLNQMTEDEKAIFNYKYANEGSESAYEFLDSIKNNLNKRETESTEKLWTDFANSGGFQSGITSALSVPSSVFGGIADIAGIVADKTNPYDRSHMMTNYSNAINENMASNLGEVGAFFYNTGQSMASSFLGATLFGDAYTVSMGASAYQNRYRDLIEQGEDETTAITLAGLDGVAESLFEVLSIDKLIKIRGVDGWKRFLKSTFDQGKIEASEEVFTEIANKLNDLFVRGDGRDVAQKAEEMRKLGYTDEQIQSSQIWGNVKDVIVAGLGGFLSGAGMGAMQSGKNYIQNSNTGKVINSVDGSNDLMGYASGLDQDSETYKLYSKYAEMNNPLTNAQAGNLYNTASMENSDEYKKAKTDEAKELIQTRQTAMDNVVFSDDSIKRRLAESLLNNEETKDKTGDQTVEEAVAGMNAETAQKVRELYDGSVDAEYLAKSVDLVRTASESHLGISYILQNRGALTEKQALDLHEEYLRKSVEAKQAVVDSAVAEQEGKTFVKGKFNDSIIDRSKDGSGSGQIKWNSLTRSQKSAITFMNMFSKATGANITLITSSVDENGKRIGKNGAYDESTNTIYMDVYAGINDATSTKDFIVPVLSHEVTHWMKMKMPKDYAGLTESVMNTLSKSGSSLDRIILDERQRMADRDGKDISAVSDEEAIDEIVARSCEDMLSNSKAMKEIMANLSEEELNTFAKKVKQTISNLIEWVNKMLGSYKSQSAEARFLRQYKSDLESISKQWDEMLKGAIKANQAVKEMHTASSIMSQNNDRYTEQHMKDMAKYYDKKNASLPLALLMSRESSANEMWKRISKSFDSLFLNDWNNKVGKDRIFTIFKEQAGYKYAEELSSMCAKGIPLFEAIDTIVTNKIMDKLNVESLGKREKEILYDMLKERGFDIPCSICYVEQARQREGVIIDAFLNGNKDGKIGWNALLDEISADMKAKGIDWSFENVSRDISTDKYVPKAINMDEATQEAFYESVMKHANAELKKHNSDPNKKRRPYLRTINARTIKASVGGKGATLNMALFRTLLENPNSRFKFDIDLLYSSMTTQNLANNHTALYSLFNRQGGTGGYKTKQGAIVYWGDILKKTYKAGPEGIREAGGIRNQSNSDFMMYQLMDYIQKFVDYSARGFSYQAYTKVIAELKILGLSGGKINASFLPSVIIYKDPDGTVDIQTTTDNAGLDKNGNLLFDSREGIDADEALHIISDKAYSKSCCGVVIGYSDAHILKVLDDPHFQMIIGFHDKTNDIDKRYAGARYAKNYNGVNEATNKKTGETVHIGFNQLIIKAEKLAGKSKNGMVEVNGKSLSTNDVPKIATELYLQYCESKNLYPAYSRCSVDFSKHENYYKLLADFGLYDSEGNYAPQNAVAFNMPDEVPCWDSNGVKTMMSTEEYITKELGKELRVRDDIAKTMADDSSDGFMAEYVRKVNGDVKNADRDSEDRKLSKNQIDYFRNSKVRDEDGRLKPVFHGSRSAGFTVFDPSKSDDRLSFFFTDDPDVAGTYSGSELGVIFSGYEMDDIDKFNDLLRSLANDQYSDYSYKVFNENGKYVLMKGQNAEDEDGEWIEDDEGYYVYDYTEKVGEGKTLKDIWSGIYSMTDYSIDPSANYEVYLNIENPMVVDCAGNSWRELSAYMIEGFDEEEFTPYDLNVFRRDGDKYIFEFGKHQEGLKTYSMTIEEIRENFDDGLANLIEGKSYSNEEVLYDSDGNMMKPLVRTRDFTEYAYANGYDGVIFKNIFDSGSESEYEEESTVYVAFSQNQIKSVQNENPTDDPDIRYADRIRENKIIDFNIMTDSELNDMIIEKYGVSEKEAKYATEGIKSCLHDISMEQSYKNNRRRRGDIRKRTIKTVALGITTEFVRRGKTDFRNTRLSSNEEEALAQIATHAMILRNPSFETFRVFYAKNGRIVHQEAFTSYLVESAPIGNKDTDAENISAIKDTIKMLGSDSVYILHNHPSGSVKPSVADRKTTKFFADNIKQFSGHIIIDHNKYSTLHYKNGENVENIGLDVLDKTISKDYNKRIVDNKFLYKAVESAKDVAHIGIDNVHEDDWSCVIYVSQKGEIRMITEIPNEMFDYAETANDIINVGNRIGASNRFVFTKDMSVYQSSLKYMYLRGYIKDAVTIGDNGIQNLKSALHQNKPFSNGLMFAPTLKTYDNTGIMYSDRDINQNLSLLAVHNTRADKLMKALKLEGLPALSTAIINIDNGLSNEGYGEISLVFDKSTIDPERAGNAVYGADIWSPTSSGATVERQIDNNAIRRFDEYIKSLSSQFMNGIFSDGTHIGGMLSAGGDYTSEDSGNLSYRFDRNDSMMSAYLQDKGVSLDPIMKPKEYNSLFSNKALEMIIDALSTDNNPHVVSDELIDLYMHADKYELTDAEKDRLVEVIKDVIIKDRGMKPELAEKIARNRYSEDREASKLLYSVLMYDQDGRPQTEEIDRVKTSNMISEEIDKNRDDYRNWIKSKIEEYGIFTGEEGLYNKKDRYTTNGRKSFKQTHVAVTAENIVKLMDKEESRGLGYSGHGTEGVQALTAKKYKSISDIKNDQERLTKLSDEKYSEMIKSYDEKLNDLINEIIDSTGTSYYNASEAFMDATRGSRTESSIKKAYRDFGINIPDSIVKKSQKLYKEIGELPSKYFEAKASRVIGFDEIKMAVIPDDSSDELKNALAEKGIPFVEYRSEDEMQRLEIIQNIDNVRFSDRDPSIYGMLDETENLKKQNQALQEEISNLNERLKIEKKITGGKLLKPNEIDAVARYIRKEGNSNISVKELAKQIKDAYQYIVESNQLTAEDVFGKMYDIARDVLKQQRPDVIKDDYNEGIYRELKRHKLKLSETQLEEIKSMMGNNFRSQLRGMLSFSESGIALDTMWGEWSESYPNLFDADISNGDMVRELIDIAFTAKESKEILQYYNDEEAVRNLGYEIYNKYWTVNPIRSTADKYEKQIQTLNKKHRDSTAKLKSISRSKLKNQKLADDIHYGRVIEKMRQRRASAVNKERQRGKQRLEDYKDRKEQARLIQKITEKANKMIKLLTSNSKDKHIADQFKPVVINLLNAIDFSSKRLLTGGEPTQKDMRISSALRKVTDTYAKLDSKAMYDLPSDFEDTVKELSNIMDALEQRNGQIVLQHMTTEDLKTLYNVVKAISSSINKANSFVGRENREMIADDGKAFCDYADNLGDVKERDGLAGKLTRSVNWKNGIPVYIFDRFGEAGRKMFSELQDGWDRFARNVNEVKNFAEATYTGKQKREWDNEIHTFEIDDKMNQGRSQTVRMSTSQLMSLYCLMQREQARGHIFGGGIRITDINPKKGDVISQKREFHVTQEEAVRMINDISPEALAVAKKLQSFLNDVCATWGNEVTQKRWDIKSFGEDNYFPINVVSASISNDTPQEKAKSLFKLLNMGFTKELTKKANNPLVVDNIFDVFANHSSDMAKYNALALPILDMYKWFNWKQKVDIDGQMYDGESVERSMESAFGKQAVSYVSEFIADLNGNKNVGRDILGSGLIASSKIASVAGNLKVIALQPTSYVRALYVLDPKYMAKAFSRKPSIQKSIDNCGMALWKSLGFYDVNINRGVTEMISQDKSVKDKIIDFTTSGAGKADEITIGYLWNACEEWAKDNTAFNIGSDEFNEAVSEKLREVIYKTQVVDSTMTRSEIMRSSDGRDKILTAFMSEPTLSINMLLSSYNEWYNESRANGKKSAFNKYGKTMARAITAYTLTNILCAIVEAGFEWLRDTDDDDETFASRFVDNFLQDMSLLSKVPVLKDIVSALQGYSTGSVDSQLFTSIRYSLSELKKLFDDEKDMNAYRLASNCMKAYSYLTGIPVSNMDRDLKAVLNRIGFISQDELQEMFNETIGDVFPSLE